MSAALVVNTKEKSYLEVNEMEALQIKETRERLKQTVRARIAKDRKNKNL